MFGLGIWELLVILLVGMVVLGPKELPRYLRKAGQFAGRLRRMAYEMREKSGIDEVLRMEGIDRDIAEIRKLARGEIADVVAAVRSTADAARLTSFAAATPNGPAQPPAPTTLHIPREYPPEGPDAYGALPDTAGSYEATLPSSPLADDPLYTRGDAAPATDAGAPAPHPDETPSHPPSE